MAVLPIRLSRILSGTTAELMAWVKATTKNEAFHDTSTGETVKGPGLFTAVTRFLGQQVPSIIVRAATTANITRASALNNTDVLDGVTLATGDYVLVKDQTDPAENGIYAVGGSPARIAAYDTWNEHIGILVKVSAGTANAGKYFRNANTTGGTLNTTGLVFPEVNNRWLNLGTRGQFTAMAANTAPAATDLLVMEDVAANGVPKKITVEKMRSVAGLSAATDPGATDLVTITRADGSVVKVTLAHLKTYITA